MIFSRCFLKDIEKWLRLALDWDGQTRGRRQDDSDHRNRPVIFEELKNILNKKLVKIFSVSNHEILSYEITSETDVQDLKRWLKEETDVNPSDQLLLLPNGKCLNEKGNVLNVMRHEARDKI